MRHDGLRYIGLGRTDEKIPVIGLGTWKYGANEKKELEALEAGIDAGARFIDTAELYGSEGIVGKAVKGRDDVFIASKVFSSHLRHDDVLAACDASLKRLGIKTIDLYQLHFPNHSVPISETMSAMELLVKQGKIRYIGVSNFSIGELEEARSVMKSNEIVSNQVEFSILTRDAKKGLLEHCQREKTTLIAYSPLGSGALYTLKYAKLLDELSAIGKAHGKTATQIALAWLLANEGVAVIPKAASKEHVIENVGAADIVLKDAELSRIDAVIRRYGKAPVWPGGVFRTLLKHTTFWYKRSEKRYGNKMED
jgi:hypothetical protein